jgi:hypothetical protein
MNTKTNNISALVILAVVLAGVCATHAQDLQEKSEDLIVIPVVYTSNDLRDPFEGYVIEAASPVSDLPPDEGDVVLPALTIAGIIWGSSFPQAIINDKVVKAGDMVGDVLVDSISKDGLVLLYKKKQFILPAPGASGVNKSNQTKDREVR